MLDFFNKDASILKTKKLWLFDMDGTIYNEDIPFEGTLELLKLIKDNGGEYVFITNNSSKSVKDYVSKLNMMGIPAFDNNLYTSSQVSIDLILENYPNSKVYCQGTKSFIKELKDAGINVTEDVEDDIDLILVGFDTELTSEKLRKTCELLNRNIPFYATNPDLVCPVSFGFVPDCGSICGMLYNATKRKPIYLGKPEPIIIYSVLKRFNENKDSVVVVGDRLYTDIAVGNNASVTSICVLTGESSVEDIKTGNTKPTYVFNSVKDIANLLKVKDNLE